MSVGNCIGRTSLNAVSAEDTAVVIDVVNRCITLGAADAVLGRVLGSFDVDAVGGAGCSTQETGNTLFQAIFVALKDMKSAKAFFEAGSTERPWAIGIILDDGGFEHLRKGDGHAFGNGGDVLHNGHIGIIPATLSGFADAAFQRLSDALQKLHAHL